MAETSASRRARPLLVLLLVWAATHGAASQAAAQCTLAPGDHALALSHDGQQRTFTVHVPVGCVPASPWPLVVDFHGFTLSGSDQAARSGMRALADREGFAVAFPDGLANAWNGIVCCGLSTSDDVGFARALVADLSQRLPIDPTRVYATGFSNGGLLTQRLACQAADLFAAAAPVAFQLPNPSPIPFPCTPARAIAVIHVHGFLDTVVPYGGSVFLQVPDAPTSLDRWRAINSCTGTPVVTDLGPGSFCELYQNCGEGVDTALCSIDGPHSVYTNNDNVEVAELAWAFLSGFTLVPEPGAETATLAGLLALMALARRAAKGSALQCPGRRRFPR